MRRMMRRLHRRLPPPKHPVWGVLIALERCVTVLCLVILAIHGANSAGTPHPPGLDVEDGAGGVGLALTVRMIWAALMKGT